MKLSLGADQRLNVVNTITVKKLETEGYCVSFSGPAGEIVDGRFAHACEPHATAEACLAPVVEPGAAR